MALFITALCLIVLPVATFSVQPEPGLGQWRTAAPALMKRTEVAAAALSDKIYVVGGFEQPGLSNIMKFAITPALEEYDSAADRWTDQNPHADRLASCRHRCGRREDFMSSAGIASQGSASGNRWPPSSRMIQPPTRGLNGRRCRPLAARCP